MKPMELQKTPQAMSNVAGYTEGGLDGNSNSGNKDLFIVKYNPDGNKQ